MATNYAADLIYFFDDFLLAGPPGQPTCSESTETMLRVCERLGIPVALDKLEGPATTITIMDHKPSHDRLMLKATITLGFFGLLRVSEFTVPNQHGFNPDQLLTAKDITMHKDSMIVVIKKSKTDQRGESCQINIGQTHTKCCPHLAIQRYLGQVTRFAKKPLFQFESGTALTSMALRLVLHHLIRRFGYSTKLYHTHSLRIGAATAVARSGLSPATIKNLGRWWSEAYKVYTCHPLTQL
ncbi:hypothetical protein EMCRGX_G005004 [Ephydatia muelleri]